jgi:hypothetical protein
MRYEEQAKDLDHIPAKDRVMERIVDSLHEINDNWYAEQASPASIILVTPLGRYNVIVVEQ